MLNIKNKITFIIIGVLLPIIIYGITIAAIALLYEVRDFHPPGTEGEILMEKNIRPGLFDFLKITWYFWVISTIAIIAAEYYMIIKRRSKKHQL